MTSIDPHPDWRFLLLSSLFSLAIRRFLCGGDGNRVGELLESSHEESFRVLGVGVEPLRQPQ